MAEQIPVITIDGPSGSGKGTVGWQLARELGWHFLDSGAIYRLLALHAIQSNANLDDIHTLMGLAQNMDIRFCEGMTPEQHFVILLNNHDVTTEIRTEETGAAASRIAAIPEVRAALLQRQRDFQQAPGLVADGRDMGTVVFPDAPVKLFITASAEERAQRRHKQLIEKGVRVNLEQILADIKARDMRDSQRKVSPLVPAQDAELIDSSHLSVEQVMQQVKAIIRGKSLTIMV